MYKLEKATLNDVEELVNLRMIEQANDWKDEYPITEELKEATRQAFMERLNKDLIMFVIKKEGKIVAQAGLLLQNFLPQADDYTGKRAYLCNVFTIEPERRKKLQLVLADAIAIYAKEIGLYRIDLHATIEDSVFEMYKKMGYQFVDNNARLILSKYRANNVNLLK